MRKKIGNFSEFISYLKLHENTAAAATVINHGMGELARKMKDDPAGFLNQLKNMLGKEGKLPDEFQEKYGEELGEDAEHQKDVAPRFLVPEEDAFKNFNKLTSDEKEAKETLAKGIVGTNEIIKPEYDKMGDYDYPWNDLDKWKYEDIINFLDSKGSLGDINQDEWNLIGIRNKLEKRQKYTNGFIDGIVLLPPENEESKMKIFKATTFPGVAYRVKPYKAWWLKLGYSFMAKAKGVAIMDEGTYTYQVGDRGGEKVLRPTNGVTIDRYAMVETPERANKITSYKPGNSESGNKSILIHSANSGAKQINNWSAGCQVIPGQENLNFIVDTIKSKNSGRVKYTLIEL